MPAVEPSADRPSPSVLVVDDSRFVRASLVRGLGPRFRLQQAESGERAWELLLLDGSIGVVLSDLSMPGMDGFELLRRVRGSLLERVRSIPFAVLSGADDPAQRARAQELGADRFVVKGDAVDALGDWVASRLEASASRPVADPSGLAVAPTVTAPDARQAPARAGEPVQAPVVAPSDVSAAPLPLATSPPADAPAAGPAAPGSALVPDPLLGWYPSAVARPARPGDPPPALLRLHAPGLEELPARLRRGVRSADALHLEAADTAWLCVPASGPLALRLAVRFGLLAAGRLAIASEAGARVSVCLSGVDPGRPGDAFAAMRAQPLDAAAPGLTIRSLAGSWGPAWQCTLPWPAARLLVAG